MNLDKLITTLNHNNEVKNNLSECFRNETFKLWSPKATLVRIYMGSDRRSYIEICPETGRILNEGHYAHTFRNAYNKALEILAA